MSTDFKRSSITSDTAIEFARRLILRQKMQKAPLVRANTETLLEMSPSNSGFSGLFSVQTVQRLSITGNIFNKRYSLNIFSELLPCGTAISQQIRAAKAVGLITLCFLFCWLPFLVMWPIKIYCPSCIPERTYNMAIWANYFNSSLNPILYALCSPRFQAVFKQIFEKYRFETPAKPPPVHPTFV